jgi:biopolymer transport protein ExbB
MRLILLVVSMCFASLAHAWWNGDWPQRSKFSIGAESAGAGFTTAVAQVPVLVRLHTGNFNFSEAKPDGSDLRFVSSDDKAPLRHHVERWDAANDLALIWVQVPQLAPGNAAQSFWMYYGNKKAPAAEDAKGTYDAGHVAVLHFAEADGVARDATGYGNNAAQGAVPRSAASLIGGGAVFGGSETLVIPAAPSIKFTAAGGFTFSAWIKAAAGANGTLLQVRDAGRGITVSLAAGAPQAVVEGARGALRVTGSAKVTGDAWQHVAVVAGKRLAVYLDGVEVGASDGEIPEIAGPVSIGAGFSGEMDELHLSNVVRSPDWIVLQARGQGPDSALVVAGEVESAAGGGDSYFGAILAAVTLDGWVVIAILGVMLVVSFWVMASKVMFIHRNTRETAQFLERYRALAGSASQTHVSPLLALGESLPELEDSSLYHMYQAGLRETKARVGEDGRAKKLNDRELLSIRAGLDAALVRENQKLGSLMVLLTISISGGPFLGLLGTVVGVMITFAAIAATGDVNVAAIAPGIAAALVATVAGLAVAIPALFGYNYIGSKVGEIRADMQVFADEMIARVGEDFAT